MTEPFTEHGFEWRPITDADRVRGNRAPVRDAEATVYAAEYNGRQWVFTANPAFVIQPEPHLIGRPVERPAA